jgi:hypothetical protein
MEELYINQTQPYFRAPHIYISMPGRFMPGRQVIPEKTARQMGIREFPEGKGGYWCDISDAVFMTSRGGNKYQRTFMESFVRPGNDIRNWTSRCNYPACGIVKTGDNEMSMYIERHNASEEKYLERLSMRIDGFASLNAGYEGGEMTTKPFVFKGSKLCMNYSTSVAGGIFVEVQNADGSPVPGYTLNDCSEIIGDEIEGEVSWNGKHGISSLEGKTVRLRFIMKDADVFSLKFY